MESIDEFSKNVPNIGYHQLILARFQEHADKVAIVSRPR